MEPPQVIEVLVPLELLGSVKLILSSCGRGGSTHPGRPRPHGVLECFELGWVESRAGPQGRGHASLFHRRHGAEFCGPCIGSHRSTEHRCMMAEVFVYCSSHIIKIEGTVSILLDVEVIELWQASTS